MGSPNEFVVYYKPYCPYSERAVELLKSKNLKHRVIKADSPDLISKFKRQNKMDTFPQIFYHSSSGNDTFIGGFDELEQFLLRGRR